MRNAKPILFGAILVLVLLSGCGRPPPPTPQRVLNVGMILGAGGLGDRSFNDCAYSGLQEAQERFGIRFETINHTSEEANLEALRRFARQEYDLIVGVGFENAPLIKTIATEFPDRNFAIIDSIAEGDNVASIIYREQEGDFLMGVLTAMLTESKKVGFIGGPDHPGMRRIRSGFEQGVAYQDSAASLNVELFVDMASTYSDPEVGKSLALAQYEAGVDVIHNACGRTGLGIIEAAKETGKLTTGTSGDQRYLAPGNVVGNRPKRTDTAVLMLVEEVVNDQFTPGVHTLGLEEEGIALGPFDEDLVTEAMLERLEDLKQQIIVGEIVIEVPGE